MKNLYCNGDNCLSYADFAGSGVVHVFGATCALIGCYFIGPRDGRFPKDGKAIDIPGHSVPLASLGGFILLFGFLAFNGGSQVIILSQRVFARFKFLTIGFYSLLTYVSNYIFVTVLSLQYRMKVMPLLLVEQ